MIMTDEKKFIKLLTDYEHPAVIVYINDAGELKLQTSGGLGRIEAAPLAYMRGKTFKNAFVILDETQNTTPTQMKMCLTSIGENCKVVVNGDTRQKDIRGMSGLEDAVNRLLWIPEVRHIKFEVSDIITAYDGE